MLYRFCFASLCLVLTWTFHPGDSSIQAADRPNVLLIMSDDLNNSLGCYGHKIVESPNIDRLAARGMRFDLAYCQFPLCGPSRNSLLTGLYPNSTGILRNSEVFRQTIPEHVSLPQAFRRSGYFAARIGKLYHYGVPNSIGTNGHDDPGSWELELNPAGVDRLQHHPEIYSLTPGSFGGSLSWLASPHDDLKHTDGMEASDAEWVLERCARDPSRPFFLAVGFFRPHTPYVAPRKYFQKYQLDNMPVVQGWKEDQQDIPEWGLGSHKKDHDKLTDELRREALQAYFASISFMDAQVGRILDALDRLKLSENTIIVFTSDHGYHLGEHGLWQKMSLFEESARVPLIMVAPGTAAPGTASTSPVGLIDVYPTLAELCQVQATENLQGQSLAPILKNPAETGRGWTLTQVTRGGNRNNQRGFGYSLRTDRWRYTEWDRGEQGKELYDHETDPLEHTNLAGDPAYSNRVDQFSKQLHELAENTFPPSGETPPLKEGLWQPLLVAP